MMTRCILPAVLLLAMATTAIARADDTPVPGTSPPVAEADSKGTSDLTRQIMRNWLVNCDAPGANQTRITLRFTLSPNGRVFKGPEWTNPSTAEVWIAAAARAKSALTRGQPYNGLPDSLYNRPLEIVFDAVRACRP